MATRKTKTANHKRQKEKQRTTQFKALVEGWENRAVIPISEIRKVSRLMDTFAAAMTYSP